MISEPGWLSTSELRALLDLCGVEDARRAVLDSLSKGHIRVQAKHADLLQHHGRMQIERRGWEVPRLACMHQKSVFDFEADTLNGLVAIDEGPIVAIHGAGEFRCSRLKFHEADTRECLGLSAEPSGMGFTGGSVAAPRQGRKPSKAWSVFAAALALWVYRRDDMAEDISAVGPDQLWGEIEDILVSEWDEKNLPRTTFRPAILEFLERIKQEAQGRK